MNQKEILADLRHDLPEDALLDSAWETIRFVIRSGFEFAELLDTFDDDAAVQSSVEHVATRIAESLDRLHAMAGVVRDVSDISKGDAVEKIDYANESAVAGAELFVDFREIAQHVVRDRPPITMRWRIYPSIVELKQEFCMHFDKLRAADATPQERIDALLHISRLQLVFLANTFC